MRDLVWIDAHHHLWDLGRIDYPWLHARGEERFFGQPDPIRRNYLPTEYLEDAAERIALSVHVQVGARPEDELAETAFVDDCSKATDGKLPAAAVVAVNMGVADIDPALDAQLAFPLTRGARHMIGKSPQENASLPPFRPGVWLPNFQRLANRGLSFDLQLTEDQYAMVLRTLERVPELGVALCHFGSPWDRSEAGFRRWTGWMHRFAELPGLRIKLSGLSMFLHGWDEEVFMRYGEAALGIFGAERCMLGSNFPVDKLYVSYDRLFSAWVRLAGSCTQNEAESLAGGTAQTFYRL